MAVIVAILIPITRIYACLSRCCLKPLRAHVAAVRWRRRVLRSLDNRRRQ